MKFLLCFLLALCACLLTRTEATAQGSYGSAGSQAAFGSYGVVGTVRANIAARRDIRQARREARQQARGWSSYGRTSYGSAGQTSYAPEPAAVVDYCPPAADPMAIDPCPNGICNRRIWLGGNRRHGIFN